MNDSAARCFGYGFSTEGELSPRNIIIVVKWLVDNMGQAEARPKNSGYSKNMPSIQVDGTGRWAATEGVIYIDADADAVLFKLRFGNIFNRVDS